MIRKSILWISLLPVACPISAEDLPPQVKRPKVGIALAGGAARGLAHVGVLQWFEEHHIPVDYIAGTSMGGLVAAYYAIGSTPAEMRQVIRDVDWAGVLRGQPSYRNLSFRRKDDRREFPNALELGLRKGIKLPIGLSGGHQIGMIFDHLALPYYGIQSFDELPIPFRCVATDVISAKPVVFKNGSLSEALRATMSIPGIFSPVEIEGVWYVDGGVLNNLPVDVVKGMGADIVIAVQLGKPPVNPESLQSFFGMVDRSFDIMILENENRNLRQADIVLNLDLGKYGSSDYKAADAIADLGYQNVEKKAAILKGLALDPEDWKQHIEERYSRKRKDLPAPQFIEVAGTRAEATAAIARRFVFNIRKPLDENRVESELARITGWGRYDSLGYRMFRAGDQNGLQIKVREKQHGPPFINLGFEINGSEVRKIKFNLNGRLTMLDVGGYRSEWRTDVSLGARTAFATEFYRPIAGTSWFVASRAFHESIQSNLFEKRALVAEYQVNSTGAGADLGYSFGRFSELRMGYEVAHGDAYVRVGDPLLPRLAGKESVASLRWVYDAQDSALVPRRGLGVRSEFEWVVDSPGATEPFPRIQVQVRFFQPVQKKSSLFLISAAGSTFGRDASITKKFALGGPLRLGALGLDEARVDQYAYSAVGLLREIAQLSPLVGGKVYAAGWYELGKAYFSSDFPGLNHTGSAGLAVDTVVGPLFFGGSVGPDGRRKVYFLLGKLF